MLRNQFRKFGAALLLLSLSLCSFSSFKLHYAYAIPTPPPSPQDQNLLQVQETKSSDPRINCKASVFLPFSQKKFNPAETPRLALRLGTNPYVHHVQMDTGSTGFLIDPAWIDGYESSDAASLGYEAGFEYLSSSHRIYTGYWVPLDVTFIGLGADEAVSSVRVLAVDQVITCPWYRREDGDICRSRPDGDARNVTVASGAGVRYMGVGFGRQADGQSQGTPDKNTLLNIRSINGRSVGSEFCSGYIISAAKDNGIYVGITNSNADRFQHNQTKLRPGSDYANDSRDWAAVPMALSVNGSPYVAGTALIDTGVEHMYLRAGITLPSVPSNLPGIPRIVANGTIVNVAIPDSLRPVVQHTFRVGDTSDPWTPPYVIPKAPSTETFINTGRYLLVAFDVLFDATFGYYGLMDVRIK